MTVTPKISEGELLAESRGIVQIPKSNQWVVIRSVAQDDSK